MNAVPETSDQQVVDLLRRHRAMTIDDLVTATGVTATAVRQRLVRMMAQGLVQRQALRAGRGRPMHAYSLTPLARQTSGNNFADLATVLWKEIREISDPQVRRGLLQRLAQSLAGMYRGQVGGQSVAERMGSLVDLFGERKVPFAVETVAPVPAEPHEASTAAAPAGLTVLSALECPYPELAEQDRGICALERMMLAELLEADVRLARCRLDGHDCCQFEAN